MELFLIIVVFVIVLALNARRKQERDRLEEDLRRSIQRVYRLEQEVQKLAAPPVAVTSAPELAREPEAPPVVVLAPPPVAVTPVPEPARAPEAPPVVVLAPPPVAVEPPPEARPKLEAEPASAPAPPPLSRPPEPVLAPPPPAPQPAPLSAPAARREDLETRFGTQWLNRIGAAILVLGIALFLGYAFTELGPWGKITLSYGVAMGMMAGGWTLEKRETYRLYGRALLASGWALTYFTTYALHHVPAVRVIQSEAADLTLLFLVAAGMIGHSLRYRTQAVTGFAYLLAYATVAISHVTFYSLGALAVLTVSMGVILWKQNWFEMELVGMAGAYLCHLSWLVPLMEVTGRLPRADFFTSAAWLAAYWMTFNLVHLARRPLDSWQARISHVSLLANAFVFLGMMRYQAQMSGLAFWALLAAGTVYLLLAAAAHRLARRTSFLILVTLGVALIFAAVPLRFTGSRLSGLWLVEAQVLLVAGFLLREIHFRRLAWLAMGITSVSLLLTDWAVRPRPGSGVLFGIAASLGYINAYWVSRRFASTLQAEEPPVYRGYSYIAALFVALTLWRVVPTLWLAPAWALAMVALAEAGLLSGVLDLRRQALALSAVALVWCLYYDLIKLPEGARWLSHSLRWPTAGLIAIAFYYLHLRRRTPSFVSYFSYAATVLVATLLAFEVSNQYLGVAFLAAALALAELGAWRRDGALRLPAYAVLSVGAFCVAGFNLAGVERRLPITSVFLAGLLWLIYRLQVWLRQGRASAGERLVSAAATYLTAGLSVWLVYLEATGLWAAPGLAVLALLFAAPGFLFNLRHFRYAAWMIHVAALWAAAILNLPAPGRRWWLTERAWTVLAVAALTYVLSYWLDRWKRSVAATEDTERTWSIVQCWLATGLLALLAWYDLRPVAVAVAWALLGVAFTEIGAGVRREHLRWQGYLLSASAFARIFFSNLAASTPLAGLSARVWTVGLLVAFFYYQFLRLRSDRDSELLVPREVALPEAYSYLGLASLAALLRFELTRPWVAVAWAVLGALVLGVAIARSDRQFRFQVYILGVMVAVRTSLNNFYLIETYAGWSARLVTVGTIVAILFGCFFLLLRVQAVPPEKARRLERPLFWIDQHSRYLYFFLPMGLLTNLLWLEVSRGLLTLAWGIEGLGLFLCGLAIGERRFRLTGLLLLLVCIGRIFLYDLRSSNVLYRIFSFLVLGAVLLIVSFLYTRYREKLNRYL